MPFSCSKRAQRRTLIVRCALAALPVAALFAAARDAHANPDPPNLDPRANAMGGGGTTFSEGAAGLGTNPSLMQYTGKGDAILALYGLGTATHAPVIAPNAQDHSSEFAPIGLAAVAVRLMPKLVLGIGVQPTAGAGVDYNLPGGAELKAIFEVIELDVAVSYAITDNFWIGAAYRPSYFSASLNEPTPTAMNPGASVKLDLSKFDPAGATVGLHYSPVHDTNLALVYRSRVTSDLDGTATTAFGTFDASSHYASPDKITLGVDHHFLDDKLLLAAQLELILYGALPGTTNSTVKTPAGTQTTPMVADDKTIYEIQLGAEYWAVPKRFAVRAGVYFGPDEGRPSHVTAISPYIGYSVSPTAGLGFRLGRWSFDATVNWQIRQGENVESTTNGNPGRYTTGGVLAGVGAVFRF